MAAFRDGFRRATGYEESKPADQEGAKEESWWDVLKDKMSDTELGSSDLKRARRRQQGQR
jgi:hypothetical protein